ncbi:LysR family transcriptional regulator [Colwellia psychrerythraea]|uniref:Transcriptional regulator, LysR family n=1 Tax=Colwellia psychrerythraea TaxID=28229 RepID=A0A099L6Q2_COLPS|nr:LysR family transcriptional regulator [Colwellia psychrerythraea]KGJ97563.1 transcriptional regulator, LysR family [Colwellia psychrerythraea]
MPKVTLDQWQMFHAVINEGSYAQAANKLFKSQSSITYGIQKLQEQLGVRVLVIKGRKAVLTEEGAALFRSSKTLLKEANELEQTATNLLQGWEAKIKIVVDAIFPTIIITEALTGLADISPSTRIEYSETVLSGTRDLLIDGSVDIAIMDNVPPGFLGKPLLNVEFQPVAHPNHSLHKSDKCILLNELIKERQIVTMDSGRERRDAGWLGAEKRWSVNHMHIAIEHVSQGLGFAWLPLTRIDKHIENGSLKAISLKNGGARYVQSYIVLKNPEQTGPGINKLVDTLIELTALYLKKKQVS